MIEFAFDGIFVLQMKAIDKYNIFLMIEIKWIAEFLRKIADVQNDTIDKSSKNWTFDDDDDFWYWMKYRSYFENIVIDEKNDIFMFHEYSDLWYLKETIFVCALRYSWGEFDIDFRRLKLTIKILWKSELVWKMKWIRNREYTWTSNSVNALARVMFADPASEFTSAPPVEVLLHERSPVLIEGSCVRTAKACADWLLVEENETPTRFLVEM